MADLHDNIFARNLRRGYSLLTPPRPLIGSGEHEGYAVEDHDASTCHTPEVMWLSDLFEQMLTSSMMVGANGQFEELEPSTTIQLNEVAMAWSQRCSAAFGDGGSVAISAELFRATASLHRSWAQSAFEAPKIDGRILELLLPAAESGMYVKLIPRTHRSQELMEHFRPSCSSGSFEMAPGDFFDEEDAVEVFVPHGACLVLDAYLVREWPPRAGCSRNLGFCVARFKLAGTERAKEAGALQRQNPQLAYLAGGPGDALYWEHRYEEEHQYDWVLPWRDLRNHLETVLPVASVGRRASVLHLGCGNSPLAEEMWHDGYIGEHVCVDTNYKVLLQMAKSSTGRGQTLDFLRSNVSALQMRNAVFACVIEKSMIDTFLCLRGVEIRAQIGDMFSEAARVLQTGGLLISVNMQPMSDVLKIVGEIITERMLPLEKPEAQEISASNLPPKLQERGITQATLLFLRRL